MRRIARWLALSAAAGAVWAVGGSAAHAEAAADTGGACIEDDPVPTPAGYAGWERSSATAWEEVERRGGVLPEIEEDPSQAPPGWWRYPSPLRSAELLADEAKDPRGLYEAVGPGDVKVGDLIVRTRGAGACGKMTVVAGSLDDTWVTLEPGDGAEPATRSGDPTFFEGKKTLRAEAAAYRIRVKKDDTLAHVRELNRDLGHLERTISERPPLVVPKGRGVVDAKLHELIDEASSLAADPKFGDERRVLTGRALALAAALDWPAAAEAAAAVLDDVLRRTPARADAILARAALFLLAGQAAEAATLAASAAEIPGAGPRAQYLLGRALGAQGKTADAAAALRRYRRVDAFDALAVRLDRLAAAGAAVPLPPAPPPPVDGPGSTLRFSATPERAALRSPAYAFGIEWPIAWRLTDVTAAPGSGLLVDYATERVLRDDGEAERGAAVVFAQRPSAGQAAAVARKAGRNIFPEAKLKPLPPLIAGSRREQFRERAEGALHQGEVTTVERDGIVYFLVLNATTATYPKLKDEFAAFVKSFSAKTP